MAARQSQQRSLRAPEIDAVLHRERLDGRAKRLHPLPMPLDELPDGAMVQAGDGQFSDRAGGHCGGRSMAIARLTRHSPTRD